MMRALVVAVATVVALAAPLGAWCQARCVDAPPSHAAADHCRNPPGATSSEARVGAAAGIACESPHDAGADLPKAQKPERSRAMPVTLAAVTPLVSAPVTIHRSSLQPRAPSHPIGVTGLVRPLRI